MGSWKELLNFSRPWNDSKGSKTLKIHLYGSPLPWRSIWKMKAPSKVMLFVWSCWENNSYLFIHCPVTGQLWQLFLNMVGIRWSMPATSVDLLKCWNQNDGAISQKNWWKLVPSCIWWTIWKERNYRDFEDEYNFVEKIKMNCIFCFIFGVKKAMLKRLNH
ncbi:hypothetical protein H5410_004371 [Solanum commersonii]|uniref:Uncharacterized protein n=1 Tax=Solanum commersonii TaxID=4109 RepID=A0A9J6B7I2_SOLCO|nr:hypothetical protein H5410_004371 [Solanum commersonii]